MKFDLTQACKGQISAVATNGKLLFPPQTCKDYTRCGVSWGVHSKWNSERGVFNPGVKSRKISLEKPLLVYWSSPKTVDKNAMKFTQMINQVETILDIPASVAYAVDSGVSDDSAPFVAEMNAWWIKSPIATDACLLFMRLSIAMRLNEDLQVFIDRMIGTEKHSRHVITRDAGYLRNANKKGNLSGFLERTLPCLNREGYSDHLLNNSERGLSQYNIKSDSKHPLDENTLVKKMIG